MTPKCNQCGSLYIQGIYCHETGCPNTHKIWDEDLEEWVYPEAEQYDPWYDPECEEEW
jgi:hypothetical protein